MAAITPSSVKQISMGSVSAYIANFANTADNGDTWASGIPNIIHVVATQGDASAVQAATGAGASYSGSTITLHLAEDNSAVNLLVLAGSAF